MWQGCAVGAAPPYALEYRWSWTGFQEFRLEMPAKSLAKPVGSAPPVRWRIPDRARGLAQRVFAGQADVIQDRVIQFGQVLPLPVQRQRGGKAGDQAARPAGRDGAKGRAGRRQGEHHKILS
jgi:hypothetical protein